MTGEHRKKQPASFDQAGILQYYEYFGKFSVTPTVATTADIALDSITTVSRLVTTTFAIVTFMNAVPVFP